ncbi:Glyoxalase-like domain protein [Acididesulfobacillus acetoxydans]|uniref:Glyoxalase-like domain protein n=1 Tax=Acididesulfobacillus acetoxydans TaxID=1561005 RepID=A0A8S0X3D8_9FIRM|nr:VOC family protein [Acididesulfobacillus acetoxydans]CAA7600000.1 Glyoxalase-like domain protein [Acididesulfobacillus acetoxydans]CEJ05986.1 Lactoylglutathione lyase-like lyase [Acididesulfobacillus acetoxydans]
MELRFGGLGIFVKDLKTLVEFYGNVFSVNIDWDGNDPYAQFEHAGIRFMMYERKELAQYLGTEISYPNGINGTFELAIDLPDFADVDKEFERVLHYGARPVVYPRNEPWGMRTSYVLDPEDNLIEIGSWGKGKLE